MLIRADPSACASGVSSLSPVEMAAPWIEQDARTNGEDESAEHDAEDGDREPPAHDPGS